MKNVNRKTIGFFMENYKSAVSVISKWRVDIRNKRLWCGSKQENKRNVNKGHMATVTQPQARQCHRHGIFLLLLTGKKLSLEKLSLRKKCPYPEFFWSVFSRIRTEYAEIRSISPYSVQMPENRHQENSKYRHFLRIAYL